MMFQRKRFFKKKNQIEIFNWGLPFQARQAKKKQVALKKSLSLHTHGGPTAAAVRVY